MRQFWLALLPGLALTSAAPPSSRAAPMCIVPERIERPKVEVAPPSEVLRAPITGYLLALSWSPQFCRQHAGDRRHFSQCVAKPPFGFILHGLWPEGVGRADPAWCAPAKLVPANVVRTSFCMTPSPQLQQHEWAKHGICMTDDPARYFKIGSILFNAIRVPNMEALSHEGTTVGQFVQTMARINPGLAPSAILVKSNDGSWLSEVQICLDINFKPRSCPRDMARMRPGRQLKIWRAGG